MERTYNFQVDNGLFILEYYLNKDYKDLTVDDLKKSTNIIAGKMYAYCKMGTLGFMSHHNSSLTQLSIDKRRDRIKNQLDLLLDNIGSDKNCMICGKRQVNIHANLPYTSLMFGLPSTDKFMNTANNLMHIDVCPLCLFMAFVSFLNTQKVSYPFLYNTDSDGFMRFITKDIQSNLERKIMLDAKWGDKEVEFSTLLEIADALEIYDDINYIELVYFANAKENFYLEKHVSKRTLFRIRKLHREGLIGELVELGLFNDFLKENHFVARLIDTKNLMLKCTEEFFSVIRGLYLMDREIKLIDRITNNLLELDSIKNIIQELKGCTTRQKFREFLIKYAEKTTIYENMKEFYELDNGFYFYKDYILASLVLNFSKLNNKGDAIDG